MVAVEGRECQNFRTGADIMTTERMTTERSSCCSDLPLGVIFQNPDQCLPVLEPTDTGSLELELRRRSGGKRGAASRTGRVDPAAGAVEQRIRSSADERPADDDQPAFAAEPGNDQRGSGRAIGRRGQSRRHDCANSSSTAFLRRRAGRRIQEIPRGFRPRLLRDAVVGRAPGAGPRRGHRTQSAGRNRHSTRLHRQ